MPSGQLPARALAPGEPFLFRTKAPHYRIVGGGILSGMSTLPVSLAWEAFEEANGVAGRSELLTAVGRYRSRGTKPHDDDPSIGCILLRDTFFVPDELGVPEPPDFARNIVQWKGYDLSSPTGSYVEQALQRLLTLWSAVSRIDGPVLGEPVLAQHRLGQRAFKALVAGAYHQRCAITGARILPTLDAAHIKPVEHDGQNRLDNGLLLRTDVHRLFDRGYLGIDETHRLHVSPRLRTEFGNGREFYSHQGEQIMLPDRAEQRPNREFVQWHMDEVFLAS